MRSIEDPTNTAGVESGKPDKDDEDSEVGDDSVPCEEHGGSASETDDAEALGAVVLTHLSKKFFSWS